MAEPHESRSFFERLMRRNAISRAGTPPERRPLLSREDQGALTAFASLALIVMAIGWLAAGGPTGGLVDIDHAEPREATFATDINSADWTELSQLPEIGEALAKRIVESRKNLGRFRSIDDLDRVRGIGPKTLERIRPFLQPVK